MILCDFCGAICYSDTSRSCRLDLVDPHGNGPDEPETLVVSKTFELCTTCCDKMKVHTDAFVDSFKKQ